MQKNQFYAYKKHLTQFLKMGSSPSWVQFHAYHKLSITITFNNLIIDRTENYIKDYLNSRKLSRLRFLSINEASNSLNLLPCPRSRLYIVKPIPWCLKHNNIRNINLSSLWPLIFCCALNLHQIWWGGKA